MRYITVHTYAMTASCAHVQSAVDDRLRERFATEIVGLAFVSASSFPRLASGFVRAGRARAAGTREISRQRG